MAEKKKKESTSRKITKEKDYTAWRDLHGIRNEREFEAVMEVRNNLERSKNSLRTSCFWDTYQEDNTGATYSGGSWFARRALQEKMRLMWYKESSVGDWQSNIKAPMAAGRVNTFVNWIKKINLEYGARPNSENDRNAAFMADKLLNYWMQNSNAKEEFGTAWEDLGTHGNSYIKVSYIRENREFRFRKEKNTDLSNEEKVELAEGKRKVVYTAPKNYTIIDDIMLEQVPLNEGFPEPQARNLHGVSYRAGWFIRKRYMTLNYFKALYEKHPLAENVDKVKGNASYRDLSDYFFEPPTDYFDDEVVEVLEMEDPDTDRYFLIAGDIPIIGGREDVPLPFDHKQSSYHKLDFIRIPGQFFSMGICDLLMNIQGAYEIALNMIADYTYRTYNYKLLVDADNHGEIQQALQRGEDMFIPIDASDGRPLNSKVMPLQVSPISFDIFRFLNILETNATLATNIDPAQMALLAGSKTATSDILNKELLMTLIGGVVDTNVNGDLRHIGRQVWALMQQFYSKKRVKQITGDDGKEKTVRVPRTVRFDGIELSLNPESSLLEENESEGDYSFFEVKPEYLKTEDELDIFIRPESTEVQSQALEEQRMGEEFAQLLPFAVDPNNPVQVQSHPMPMVDAVELFQEYFDVRRLPQKFMINRRQSNSKSLAMAEKHVMAILTGNQAQAIPGQVTEHLEYEYQVLNALTYQKDQKEVEIQDDLEKQSQAIQEQYPTPMFDQYTGQPIPPPAPIPNERLVSEREKLNEVILKLQQHLVVESMPAAMRQSRIMTLMGGSEESTPEQGIPMATQMPQGGQNPIAPEMINPANPAGQVPMGSAPMTLPNQLRQAQV